jgi:homoserine O-acetyltransferase
MFDVQRSAAARRRRALPFAHFASVFFAIATNGGNFGHYGAAPTREAADKELDKRMAAPFRADANDVLYQWDSSRDYNPSPNIHRITATLLAVNAADDERNPLELGTLEREMKRVPNGRILVIPAGPDTRGHGTTGSAPASIVSTMRPRDHRSVKPRLITDAA